MADLREVQEAIRRGITPLWIEGSVYELRVPKTRQGTVSGYFDSIDALAAQAAKLDGQADGVYMTLNPVHPALLARAANKVRSGKPKATGDDDVPHRSWLLLDFDPVRPSETSSTNEQHDAALRRSGECARWLISLGFPRDSLVGADSGNGAHLLIRVDLPNDGKGGAASALVSRCLQAVAIRFSDAAVAADMSTGSASHLMKVYGTRACKGENLPEYPHRSSRLVVVPDVIEPASQDALERLASCAPTATETRGTQGQTFDLEAFIHRHLGDVAQEPVPWNGGRLWRLRECVFSSDHGDGNPALIQLANGAIAYHCFKPSCAEHRWSDVREMLEPKPLKREGPALLPRQPRPVAPEPEPPKLLVVDSMLDIEDEEIEWLWYPFIPKGKLTLLEGDPGCGKTWYANAVMAALSAGYPLPGTEALGVGRVLLLAGEDGYGDTIKPRLRSLGANLANIRPVLGLYAREEEHMMTLTPEGLKALESEVEKYRPALVVIDPLVAYIAAGVDINKSNEVRAILRPVGDMAQRYGAAIIGIRHLTKATHSMALYRGQGSIDFAAISRSVLLAVRDPNNPTRRLVAPSKASLAPEGQAQEFFLSRSAPGQEFQWGNQTDLTAQELLASQGEGEDRSERSALEDAQRFLTDILFEGPRPAKEVQHEAREAGTTEKTLFRAKSMMGIRSIKERGAGGRWMWELAPPNLDHVAIFDHLSPNVASTSQETKVVKDGQTPELDHLSDFPSGSGDRGNIAKDGQGGHEWWNDPDREPF